MEGVSKMLLVLCVCWRSPWYGIHIRWWTVSLCLSLYPRPVQSILLNLSRDMGRSQPSRISFLFSVEFFPNCIAILCFLFSLFLSKLLHELRRFQTAAGHCCVYNIDVSFGCIVTSFACGWGGRTLLERYITEWVAGKSPKRRARRVSLSRTCFYISHEMQQQYERLLSRWESEIKKTADIFIFF